MALLAFASLLAIKASAAEPLAIDWSEIARRDLDKIRSSLLEVHPAAAEKTDPAFWSWLDRGYEEAQKLADKARSDGDALAAARYYAVGFHDDHLAVYRDGGGTRIWAGWRTAKRGEDFVVVAGTALPGQQAAPIGARLQSCDGRPVRDILAAEVAPYVDRRLQLESTWYKLAPYLSTRFPWHGQRIKTAMFKQCKALLADGSTVNLHTRWRDDPDVAKAATQAREVSAPINKDLLEDLGDGRYWVRVSEFQPDAAGMVRHRKLLADLEKLDHPQLVVLDTRGNQGGNSGYGNEILLALLGDYSALCKSEVLFEADYRVSDIAIRDKERLSRKFVASEGKDCWTCRYMDAMVHGLEQAQKEQQTWYPQARVRELLATAAKESAPEKLAVRYQGAVALITDSYCASACLNFADHVRSLKTARHYGRATAADTIYNEPADIILRNDIHLWIPTKVMRQRTRANNEPYMPDLPYAGDIEDTAQLKVWLLSQYDDASADSAP